MTFNPGWKFKLGTVILGVVTAYIFSIGPENATAIEFSAGGIAIGLALADVLTHA